MKNNYIYKDYKDNKCIDFNLGDTLFSHDLKNGRINYLSVIKQINRVSKSMSFSYVKARILLTEKHYEFESKIPPYIFAKKVLGKDNYNEDYQEYER